MVNAILKYSISKELVFYTKHRQTYPIVNNPENKKHLIFFDPEIIWKMTAVFGKKSKLRYTTISLLLSFFSPKYILNINWLTKRDTLFYVWCKKSQKSKFVVMQHGSYVGGIVTDVHHRLAKCQIFLCWSEYFKSTFENFIFNKKNTKFIAFGNPVYNQYDRSLFNYNQAKSNTVLILPTALDRQLQFHYTELIQKLQSFGFQVYYKEHSQQQKIFGELPFKINKIDGSLYEILQDNDYDFIIADHSSSLLDSIFFKNKVLYFDANNKIKGYTTNYSDYLLNLFDIIYTDIHKKSFYQLINIENQEALLANMIINGDNKLEVS